MTSVMLEWQPPAQPNGIITAYKITAINTQQTVIVNSSITRYTFCGLQRGQLVSYTISASTEDGEGPILQLYNNSEKSQFTATTTLISKFIYGPTNCMSHVPMHTLYVLFNSFYVR